MHLEQELESAGSAQKPQASYSFRSYKVGNEMCSARCLVQGRHSVCSFIACSANAVLWWVGSLTTIYRIGFKQGLAKTLKF